MAAKTLEAKLDDALEHVEIGVKVLRQGIDVNPPIERLEWIQARVAEAVELQKKIDKRNARHAERHEACGGRIAIDAETNRSWCPRCLVYVDGRGA